MPASSGVDLGWVPICHHDGSSVRGEGGGGSLEQGGARKVTSEGLIQVLLAKDDIKVMHSTCVELHAENHVTCRAAKLLVVTLQLWMGAATSRQDEPPRLDEGSQGMRTTHPPAAPHVGGWAKAPYQDIALEEQARLNGDADARLAVSLHVAAERDNRRM